MELFGFFVTKERIDVFKCFMSALKEMFTDVLNDVLHYSTRDWTIDNMDYYGEQHVNIGKCMDYCGIRLIVWR